MNWRILLLTSALTMAAPAMAATLQPASEWAVTRVPAKNAAAAPYCALARRFDNNVIMTFARNTRDETSIAIDFQQPIFDAQQSINVVFDSGSEPREFVTKPASTKAVVARIGADKKFFSELEAHKSLGVSIMGQDYDFPMPDMASANAQLQNCLVAMSSSTLTTPAQDADADNKIAALQDQIETLRTQRDSMATNLNEPKYNTKLQAAAGGGSNADLAQKISDLQMQNLSLRNGVETQRSAYDNLQTKSLEDKSRVALLEETQDQLKRAQEDTAKFRDQLTTTQTRQDTLLQKLEKYSSEEAKRKELEQHLVTVKAENDKLVANLNEEKDRLELVKSAQDAVVAQQATELNKTKAALTKTAEERDSYKSRLSEFSGIRDKLTALATEQKQLGTTVQSLRAEREDLTKKLDAEHGKLSDIQTAKKTLEEQVASGDKEKADLQKLLDQEKAKRADIAKLQGNLDDVTNKQKDLAEKVGALEGDKKGLQIRINDLEARVKKVEAEKAEMADALDDADQLSMAQSDTIDTLTLKQKNLLTQVASLEADKKDLLAQVDTQKTKLADLSSDTKKDRDYKFDSDRMTEQLSSVTKERDDLQQQLSAQKETNQKLVVAQGGMPEKDAHQLFSQVEELEYQRVDLNSAIEFERNKNLNSTAPAAGSDTASLAELRASLAAAQAQRDEYKRLLDNERDRTKSLEAVAGPQGAQDTVAELNGRIKKLEADNVTLLRELEYQKSKNGDVATASTANIGATDAVTVSSLREEIKRLQQNAAAMETKQAELLAQIRMMESEKQKMTQAQPAVAGTAANDREKADLQMKIVSLQAEKDSLSKALAQRPVPSVPAPVNTGATKAANDEAAKEIVGLRTQLAQAQTLLAAREAQTATPPPIPAPVQKAALPPQTAMAAPAYNAPVAKSYPPSAAANPVVAPIVDKAEPMAQAAPAQANTNMEGALRDILTKAGINPSSFGPIVLPVASDVQGWRWKTGKLAGNAEAHPASDSAAQNGVIETFLSKAKSRCPGDFAVIENSRTQTSRGLIVSSDIACVSGANGVAAALAFIQIDGELMIIAHESDTAGMPEAMMTRDKIVQGYVK